MRVILDVQQKLKGNATLKNIGGYLNVGGRNFRYNADVELSVEVQRKPTDFPDKADLGHNASMLKRIDESLTAAGRIMGDYLVDREKEVDKSMQSGYIQSQFHSFSWSASASIIDLGGALVNAVSGKKIQSGNEMVGPVWNNATSGVAMVIHNIILP
jgi:hypothetical protein